MKNKKEYKIIDRKRLGAMMISILGLIVIVAGMSYAILSLTLSGTKTNVLRAGVLEIILDESISEGILLENAVPLSDAAGMQTRSFSFLLKNTGDFPVQYTLTLGDEDITGTRMPDDVVKYWLKKDAKETGPSLISTMTDRVFDKGIIQPGRTYSYELKLWIDYNAGNEIQGNQFKVRINATGTQVLSPEEEYPEETDAACFAVDETGAIIEKYLCPMMLMDPETGEVTENPNGIADVVIPKTINGVIITQIGYSMDELDAACSTWTEDTDCYEAKNAFNGASVTDGVLKTIVMPDSITSIGENAFDSSGLEQVTLGKGVTEILYGAFAGTYLTELKIPDSVITIGDMAFSNNALTTLTLGKKVETIGQDAFTNNQLQTLVIPDSVTTIGAGVFFGNNLSTVTVGKGVTMIDQNAFWKDDTSNPNLTKIINKTGRSFDWGVITMSGSSSFVTGTITHPFGNITVTAS